MTVLHTRRGSGKGRRGNVTSPPHLSEFWLVSQPPSSSGWLPGRTTEKVQIKMEGFRRLPGKFCCCCRRRFYCCCALPIPPPLFSLMDTVELSSLHPLSVIRINAMNLWTGMLVYWILSHLVLGTVEDRSFVSSPVLHLCSVIIYDGCSWYD